MSICDRRAALGMAVLIAVAVPAAGLEVAKDREGGVGVSAKTYSARIDRERSAGDAVSGALAMGYNVFAPWNDYLLQHEWDP